MSKKTRHLSGDGSKVYQSLGQETSEATGRKLKRIMKHKPYLFYEENNAGHMIQDEDGNVHSNVGTNAKGKSAFKTYFQKKQEQVMASYDLIWFAWFYEVVQTMKRDILLSIRNLIIISSVIAIIARLV